MSGGEEKVERISERIVRGGDGRLEGNSGVDVYISVLHKRRCVMERNTYKLSPNNVTELPKTKF